MNSMAAASNLPVEAEEANKSLMGLQVSAVLIGLVFIFFLAYMAYDIDITPGLPWLGAPLGAMAFFAVGAVTDLGLGIYTRSAVHRDWAEGKITESYARLGGLSQALLFVVGGIVPGIFARAARRRLSPLVEMQHGSVPMADMYAPAGGPVPAGAPVMPGAPAPAPPPRGPAPSAAPSPSGSWAPPASSAMPPAMACPQCGMALTPEDRFCRGCGKPVGSA